MGVATMPNCQLSHLHAITLIAMLPVSFSCTVVIFLSSYRIPSRVNVAEIKDTTTSLLLIESDKHDNPFCTKAITIIDNFKKAQGDTDNR